jgi:hypothetical protein
LGDTSDLLQLVEFASHQTVTWYESAVEVNGGTEYRTFHGTKFGAFDMAVCNAGCIDVHAFKDYGCACGEEVCEPCELQACVKSAISDGDFIPGCVGEWTWTSGRSVTSATIAVRVVTDKAARLLESVTE